MAHATDEKSPAPQTGVKKGLPRLSLKTAEGHAEKLWQVARNGSVPHDAFAKALGMGKASGGTWDKRLALVRLYGLVDATKNNIRLSPIGLDIVQSYDDEKRRAARRQAFLKVRAYTELVESYDGTELPDRSQIASKLQFQYGKTPEAAVEAAGAFIESIRYAGLLDSENYVRRAGAGSAPPATEELPVDDDTTAGDDEDGEGLDDVDAELEELPDDEDEQATTPDLEGGPVSLSLTLDLSRFRADEIIEILSALGLARRPRA